MSRTFAPRDASQAVYTPADPRDLAHIKRVIGWIAEKSVTRATLEHERMLADRATMTQSESYIRIRELTELNRTLNAERTAARTAAPSSPAAPALPIWEQVAAAYSNLQLTGTKGKTRVALDGPKGTRFYTIKKGASRYFVDAVAGPNTYPVKRPDTLLEIAAALEGNEQAAMLRYGAELGECGRCGLALTHVCSRMISAGSTCADALGIAYPTLAVALEWAAAEGLEVDADGNVIDA